MHVEELPSANADQQRVGEQLRRLRQDKALSLDAVSTHTKISRVNLCAIESMTFDQLPADPFTRGQLILYGEFLGLDGRQVADRFFNQRDGGKKSRLTALQQSLNKQPLTPKKLAEPAHVSAAAIATMLLAFIICSFTVFCLYYSWNPFALLTEKVFHLSGTKNTAFHPADPATSNASAHLLLKLQAHLRKDCRILISVDNHPPFEQQHAKGARTQWEADKQLFVEFMQPDCADLLLNGMPLTFPPAVDGRYRLSLTAPVTSSQ